MVRIGIIGIGFMGMIHYYGAKKVSGGEVVRHLHARSEKIGGAIGRVFRAISVPAVVTKTSRTFGNTIRSRNSSQTLISIW